MKKKQQLPMVKKDIADIIKAIKLLDSSQKKEVMDKITELMTKPDD